MHIEGCPNSGYDIAQRVHAPAGSGMASRSMGKNCCSGAPFSLCPSRRESGSSRAGWRDAMWGCAKGVVILASAVLLTAQGGDITYHLESTQPLSRFNSKQRRLLQKLNRADAAHLGGSNRLIVPSRWDLEELAYSPLPESIEQLSERHQALVVDLP